MLFSTEHEKLEVEAEKGSGTGIVTARRVGEIEIGFQNENQARYV